MSTESLNRDEEKFGPTVDAEELTTLEDVSNSNRLTTESITISSLSTIGRICSNTIF